MLRKRAKKLFSYTRIYKADSGVIIIDGLHIVVQGPIPICHKHGEYGAIPFTAQFILFVATMLWVIFQSKGVADVLNMPTTRRCTLLVLFGKWGVRELQEDENCKN